MSLESSELKHVTKLSQGKLWPNLLVCIILLNKEEVLLHKTLHYESNLWLTEINLSP